MKRAFFLVFIAACCCMVLKGQGKGPFLRAYGAVDLNLELLRLRGPFNTNPDVSASGFSSSPEYNYADTTAIVGGAAIHFGLQLAFLRKRDWSAGIRVGAGVGHNYGFKAAKGLSSILFTFPQSAYFTFHRDTRDITLFAGYRYTYTSLSYHANVLGIEFMGEGSGIRIQTMVLPFRYWGLKTNGELFPAIGIRDFGVSFVKYFGRGN
jgi:hypothetical protein